MSCFFLPPFTSFFLLSFTRLLRVGAPILSQPLFGSVMFSPLGSEQPLAIYFCLDICMCPLGVRVFLSRDAEALAFGSGVAGNA